MFSISRFTLVVLVVVLQACGGGGSAKQSNGQGISDSSLAVSSFELGVSSATSSIATVLAPDVMSSPAVTQSSVSVAASASSADTPVIVASSSLQISSSSAENSLSAVELPGSTAASTASVEAESSTSNLSSVALSSVADSSAAVSSKAASVVSVSSVSAQSSTGLSSESQASSSLSSSTASSILSSPSSSNSVSSESASSVSSSSSSISITSWSSAIASSSSAATSSLPTDFPVGTVEALPVLAITTDNSAPIESKEDYITGSFSLADAGTTAAQGTLEIRGRGNSTWGMPKKPYRLKLTTSTSLLAMPANRHWVLLANYADRTLMRNDIAFMFSRSLGMEYTVRSRYVDLTVNGVYQGVYQLAEHIRIGKDRVNVPELKVSDTTADKISGGYLMEIDERRGEDFCVDTKVPSAPMAFCMANPETLALPEWSLQRNFISQYIHDTETAIFSMDFTNPTTGYAAYIDIDSMINYYLANELFRNVDGDLRLSTYLYKKRDGKLFFGPLWDFDLSIGNVGYSNAEKTQGWHIRNAPWFEQLFKDPVFRTKVKARWLTLKEQGKLEQIFQYAEARALWLEKAQAKNFATWSIVDSPDWLMQTPAGSYQGEVDVMKTWLRARMEWMDNEISDPSF